MRVVSFAVTLSLCATPAYADPVTSAPSAAQVAARDAFADGERSFSRGAYEAALASFERAFRLVSHDAVRFNIAVCLERLQRYRDAREQYRAARESAMLGPEERARAAQAVERLGHELGVLVVDGSARAEPVGIDGEVRCTVPCRIELDPHTYRVAVGEGAARLVRIERGAELRLSRAPVLEPVMPAAAETAPSRGGVDSARHSPGWLTWSGAAVAAVGAGGVVGFGLRTQRLHDSYVDEPSASTRDQGLFARAMTNVSIGVAVVGVALVAVDLFVLAPSPRGAP
ncbi:MAG: tetratricopeptide repeat protein [Polyangiaceae bacterium]